MSTQIAPLTRGQAWQIMHPVPFGTLPSNPTILDRCYIGMKERILLRGWAYWNTNYGETEAKYEDLWANGTTWYSTTGLALNEASTELPVSVNYSMWVKFLAGYCEFLISSADSITPTAWIASRRDAKIWDGIGTPTYIYGQEYPHRSEILDFWIFDDIQKAFTIFDDNYVP